MEIVAHRFPLLLLLSPPPPLIVIFNRKKEREEFLNTDLSREFPDRREII